jgi:hypothetical protein
LWIEVTVMSIVNPGIVRDIIVDEKDNPRIVARRGGSTIEPLFHCPGREIRSPEHSTDGQASRR